MKSQLSRRRVLQGMAGVVGLAAAGCAPTTPGATPSNSSGTQGGTPKRGGVLRTVYQTELPHLDPTLEASYASHGGLGAPYSRLIQFKTGPGIPFTSTEVAPDLVVSWEQPDPVTYILKLRQGVKWHNKAPMNGRAFTAEDARWSLMFYADKANKNVHSALFANLLRVDVVDPQTLKITLSEPQASFLTNGLANHYAKMMPPEVFEKEGSFKNTVVGTGAFMFDRWERGTKLAFVRNPEYYDANRVYLDGFEWIFQNDYASRLAMIRSNDLDYGPEPAGVNPEDVESVKQAVPSLLWSKQQRANMYWVAMNLTKKPFDDVRVRQAVSLAIDRKDITDTIFFGDATFESIMPHGLMDWVIPESETQSLFGKRDIAKAKQLLSAAGYPNGFETELIPRQPQGFELSMAEAIVSMLKDIGINARMRVVTAPEWTAAMAAKNYSMSSGLGQTGFEPDDWTFSLYHSKSARNWWGYSDAKADAMMEKARTESNVAARKALYLEIQRYLNDQLPVVPTVYRFENVPRYPYVKDLQPHWTYNLQYYKDVWLDK